MTAIARKIAALEAKAASTTFPAEAETCRRLAEKLRGRADAAAPVDPAAVEAAQSDLEFAVAWAAIVLEAIEVDLGFDIDGNWIVPGHGPALDDRGLTQLAFDRGHRPSDQVLQAAVVRAMRWRA